MVFTARLVILAACLAILATRLATRLATAAVLATLATLATLAVLATREFRERTLYTTRGTTECFRNTYRRTVKRTPCDIHRGPRNVPHGTLRCAHYTANEARCLA